MSQKKKKQARAVAGGRNRKARKNAEVYRVEKLFRSSDREELLIDGETHFIEGKLGAWLVASVPETITTLMADELRATIQKATGRPVLIVTHNVEIMRAVLVSPKEAAQVVRRAELATAALDGKMTHASEDASRADSDGVRPGVGGSGGGDSAGDAVDPSGDSVCESDPHEADAEEETEVPSS